MHELEELHFIKVRKENLSFKMKKLFSKYKGVFSKEDAASFEIHTKNMRSEWKNI